MTPIPAPAGDSPLPGVDVRALARRAALPAALLAVLAAVLVAAGGPLETMADAIERAAHADARWVAAAVAFELLSFTGYVALLWLVCGRVTRRIGLRESAEVTLGGAAATRLLPAGGIGGVALTIWALRRAGLDARTATRTLLTFLVVLYAVFLGAIVVAGGLLASGLAVGGGPTALSAMPAGLAATAIAIGLLASRRPATDGRGALRHAATLGAAVRDALALIRSGDLRLLGALVWWGCDVAVLWAMLEALGAPPSPAVVALAYFAGQAANTLPIPGAVSGGVTAILIAFGVQADLALAAVLAYRSVAIWLPAPVGLAALGGLRRTVARWAPPACDVDADEAAIPAY